jgi:protein-tyrosine phosphatase
MLDIHSHILPGIDDGARDIGHSLEMARKYVTAGYTRVIATPHAVPEDRGVHFAQSIDLHVANLNAIMQEDHVALTVLPGMEITLAPETPTMLDKGEVIPLAGGSYVLIELPFQRLPLHWDEILFKVAGRGFKILIAHPERCAQLAQTPMLIERLLETGVYLQVNWTSLLGYHGKAAQKTARHLARSGAIHCMATDSHDTRERSAIIVRRGAEELTRLVGRRNLALLSVANPAQVLNGNGMAGMAVDAIPNYRPIGGGGRRFFSFFRKR